jgi:hypothetical protein
MTAIGRADDCAPQRHDPVDALTIENGLIAGWKETFESIPKTNYFPAELLGRKYHTAQDRVKSRAIAATR